MRIITKTMIAPILMGLAMMTVSCDSNKPSDRRESRRKEAGKGEVLSIIMEDIDSLRVEISWKKAQWYYAKIQEGIRLLQSQAQRENLLGAADDAYCHSMDSIMGIIMSGECKSRHDELAEIWSKRTSKAFNTVDTISSLHVRVVQLHNEHQKRIDYIISVKNDHQSVTSFNIAYNRRFETDEINNATNYLSNGYSCVEILDGLNSIKDGTIFVNRRYAYCQKVVSLYLSKDSYDEGDENTLISNIKFYPKWKKNWEADIDKFRDEHQPQAPTN